MSVRLQYMSDLHLEFEGSKILFEPEDVGADVLILAGDIHLGTEAIPWIQRFASRYSDIIYIPGNHEYYRNDWATLHKELAHAAESIPNLHFLDPGAIQIHNIHFIAATLWTDFKENNERAKVVCERGMSDYRVVRNSNSEFNQICAGDTYKAHQMHKSFIKTALADSPYPTVVITHHAPSFQSIDLNYVGDELNAGYASNLDKLVEEADIWIHGHIHASQDYHLGKCNVLSNPRGYVGHDTNYKFDPGKIVEIDI